MAPLQGRYDFKSAEPRLQAEWASNRIYEFDPRQSDRPSYTVDTPPPTVSGAIHMGHVYSYTHPDIMIRYHRMRGEQVLYPFGFDDNGLPTERFTESTTGIRARDVGRQAFIEACLALSEEVETKFERFWKRLGLSVDWRLRYSTIDTRSRRISQAAFIHAVENKQVYRQKAPTLWCPECRTAVAQAEVDDKEGVASTFTTIPFEIPSGGEIPIATTRPELLPACVGVLVHPRDERYRNLIGKQARTPIFNAQVPILADEQADPEKGTGAVMCCTFGDVTDVGWWRAFGLPLRVVLTSEGRLNDLAGTYQGLAVREARARLLEDLASAGKVLAQRNIEHTVGVHERCGMPIEYLVVGQWFYRILDRKQELLGAGRRIHWHPAFMRVRYETWIEGLKWDWNLSRQRYYGVAFPVWYCRTCEAPMLARLDQLPVDPQADAPPVDTCASCGGVDIVPETDVMDTWATSSVTPQIVGTLLEPLGISPDEFDRRFRPMGLRPNAHDIIRTWDFYTVVRSLSLTGDVPWRHVMISGHAVDPSGAKLSKSKLKTADDPTPTLEQFSADAVRYWTAGVRTGSDTTINEEALRNGQKLVTKLWNAAKLGLSHLQGYRPPADPPEDLNATDRWLLARLHETITRVTADLDEYEFAAGKAEIERFFWTDLCDNYLELAKFRLYRETVAQPDAASFRNAQYTIYHALLAVLEMLAPYMPHITEEIYLTGFADIGDGGSPSSIHLAQWPVPDDRWIDPTAHRDGAAILRVVDEARRWKAGRQLSMGAPLQALRITSPDATVPALQSASVDLRSVSRANEVYVSAGAVDDVTVEIEYT